MPDDAFVAEVTRLQVAAATLSAINTACTGGIPSDGLWPAASAVVAAYLTATPLPSPIRTGA